MIIFPNCKINLGLRILQKRTDGFHNIETVFYPLPFYDVLELVHSQTGTALHTSGISIDTASADNLCLKAYELLRKDFPAISSVEIHLHKNIPSGAGLGGGSADAAFMLQLLNLFFRLEIDKQQLMHYALQLGSDCPFFIINTPCVGTGRGEQLTPLVLDLSSYQFVLVNPGIHVSTGQAFSGIIPVDGGKSVHEIIQQPINTWKDELVNDFEAGIFQQYPVIGEIKEQLYHKGAVYASMSGTGSTVYGIFPQQKSVELSFPEHYFIKYLVGQA